LVQLGKFLARDVNLLLLFLIQLGRHGRFRYGLNAVDQIPSCPADSLRIEWKAKSRK
jgi:hypothetical protein